jgi:hypothetical protein
VVKNAHPQVILIISSQKYYNNSRSINMPNATNMVARFSGLLTYSDGTTGQFAGQFDENGLISLNNQPDGQINFINAVSDEDWLMEMVNLLDPGGPLAVPSKLAVTKTMTDMAAELSGHVSYDDGTHGGFITQYTHKTGAYVPTGGSVYNFQQALDNSALLTRFYTLIGTIAGFVV